MTSTWLMKSKYDVMIMLITIGLTFNHLSTHFAWNSWLQGRMRSSCLFSKSHMQMTQDVWSEGDERTSEL